MKTCPACWKPGSGNCYMCCGSGTVQDGVFGRKKCVKCNGTGSCKRCNGKGVVPED